ncbi:hypothetical protein TNCV_1561331 [Trichonephila clavipes]|nr:hypothetical protein TNCV_1561331 [Trichonephila clavipes]
MNRCPDLVLCLKRDLQCLRPEASLVLIYRPNVAGMKGRVDLPHPVNRTPDLCEDSMNAAVHEAVIANDNNSNIAVAVDGTWHKRGYSSLNGVVCATSVENG